MSIRVNLQDVAKVTEGISFVLVSNLKCACLLSHFSHAQLFVTLWTVDHQIPLSKGFSRQEHWSGLPCSSPGHLPDPGIEPASLTSPALAGGCFTTRTTWEAQQLKILDSNWLYFNT